MEDVIFILNKWIKLSNLIKSELYDNIINL